MPMTNKFYSTFDSLELFDNMISKNAKYYNFNLKLKLNDSLDFFDSHHLNQNGVLKTNQYLIKILDSINL
jgi:imidazoleglycerol phosphate dehydratase HisB